MSDVLISKTQLLNLLVKEYRYWKNLVPPDDATEMLCCGILAGIAQVIGKIGELKIEPCKQIPLPGEEE